MLLRGGLRYVADRILSVAWYEPENVIVTGGVDCIRVWSVHSGQAVVRLETGRVAAQVHTYVHAVCVTEYVIKFVTVTLLLFVIGHKFITFVFPLIVSVIVKISLKVTFC